MLVAQDLSSGFTHQIRQRKLVKKARLMRAFCVLAV